MYNLSRTAAAAAATTFEVKPFSNLGWDVKKRFPYFFFSSSWNANLLISLRSDLFNKIRMKRIFFCRNSGRIAAAAAPEFAVFPAPLGQEFFVRAGLSDAALVHHEDLVRVLDRGESVGDRDASRLLGSTLQSILDNLERKRVKKLTAVELLHQNKKL